MALIASDKNFHLIKDPHLTGVSCIGKHFSKDNSREICANWDKDKFNVYMIFMYNQQLDKRDDI